LNRLPAPLLSRAAIAALLPAYCGLALLSREPERLDFWTFLALMAAGYAGLVLAYCAACRGGIGGRTVLAFALLFRGIGGLGEPVFEDDWFRYLWDGYRFAAAGTPYGVPPAAFFHDPAVPAPFRALLGGVNYPELPTIYGPTAEYAFLGAYGLAPAKLWPLKLLLSAVDLALVGLLLRLAPARRVLLYAWNPLVVKEIAFTAHPDGLIGAGLLAAWALSSKNRHASAALGLALAAGVKVSAGLALPLFLARMPQRAWGVFAAALALLYAPFLWQGATEAAGLAAFAGTFEFNSGLYALVSALLPERAAKGLLGAAWLALWFGVWRWRNAAGPPRVDLVLGGLLLVSPVANPWYLLWWLPFACLAPSLTAWVATAAVVLAYATGLNLDEASLGAYGHPVWARPLEYGLVLLALGVDSWLWLRRRLRLLH
jgi:hypothetical protein